MDEENEYFSLRNEKLRNLVIYSLKKIQLHNKKKSESNLKYYNGVYFN